MLNHRIKTFLTLCQTLNHRKAAEILHITQPAVTQHIRYLEQEYDCRLFSYDGRQLQITPQGELLERYANTMQIQEEKLRQAMKPKSSCSLRIGVTKTIGEYVIPDQVSAYLQKEDHELELDVDNTARILNRLDHGELDFALIEGYFDRAYYGSKLYRQEPFVGLCSLTHPFAGKTVSIDKLWKETLLLREEGSGTRRILEGLLEARHRSIGNFQRVVCISNFDLLEQLTAKNNGITFAYAAVGAKDQELSQFYVEGWEAAREFNYVYLPDTGAEEAVAIFEKFRKDK